jgi:hypothetical protein
MKKQKTITNQVIETKQIQELVENKRESHGRNIALTKNVYRLMNSDTFYVESESTDNLCYFVKYNPSVFEWCACPDNSTRHIKCKHLYAIEFAIRFGTLKDIDKLPVEAKRYGAITTTTAVSKSLSYEEDEYSF